MPEVLKKITGTIVAFGDVVQMSKERSQDPEADGFERYIGLEHLEPSDLKVRSWGDISDGVTFTSVFRPGQVLFGKRRAYQRKVAVADFSGVCSGDIYVLEPKGNHLIPELLAFICQSQPFYDYVISMSQGGLSPRVNWEALAKYEFVLPPLEEQRRIMEVLQAMENYIEKLSTTVDALNSLSDAYLREVFPSGEDELLAGWKSVKLGDVAFYQEGPGLRSWQWTDNGMKVVNGTNVLLDGTINLENTDKHISLAEFNTKYKHFAVEDGDILLVSSGSYGKVARIRPRHLPLMMNTSVIRLHSLNSLVLDDEFLLMYLRSSEFTEQLDALVTGSAQLNFGPSHLSKTFIPLPSLEEQKRIADNLNSISLLVDKASQKIEAIKRLKQSFMKEYLA